MSTDAARNAHRELWTALPTRTLSVGGRVAERTTDSDTTVSVATQWRERPDGPNVEQQRPPPSSAHQRARHLPDAGHGGIFQFHQQFVTTTLEFPAR